MWHCPIVSTSPTFLFRDKKEFSNHTPARSASVPRNTMAHAHRFLGISRWGCHTFGRPDHKPATQLAPLPQNPTSVHSFLFSDQVWTLSPPVATNSCSPSSRECSILSAVQQGVAYLHFVQHSPLDLAEERTVPHGVPRYSLTEASYLKVRRFRPCSLRRQGCAYTWHIPALGTYRLFNVSTDVSTASSAIVLY
jgi:hypothetical protein